MFTMALRIASVAMLAVLVGACADSPTSPARAGLAPTAPVLSTNAASGVERWVEERLTDVSGELVALACGEDGYTEFMILEGKVFESFTITWDATGGIHALTHTMPVGLRGVGVTTGAEYRIAERANGTFNHGAMEQTAGTYQSFLTFFSPELGVRGRLVVGGTLAINANGQVIIDRSILRADCRE